MQILAHKEDLSMAYPPTRKTKEGSNVGLRKISGVGAGN